MSFPNAYSPRQAFQPGYRLNDGQALLDLTSGKMNFTGISLAGYMAESSTDSITAYAGGGQTSATALTAELNRVTTVASPGDSVMLPPSVAGLTIILENAAANPMQVYGAGTDTINSVSTATGVSQMGQSVVIYTCYTAGAWFANGLGTGYAGSLETQSTTTGIAANSGGVQAGATALTTMLNNITTGGANYSVALPATAAGLAITVVNNSGAAVLVFAPSGSSMNGTLNGSSSLASGSVGIYFAVTTTAWVSK